MNCDGMLLKAEAGAHIHIIDVKLSLPACDNCALTLCEADGGGGCSESRHCSVCVYMFV